MILFYRLALLFLLTLALPVDSADCKEKKVFAGVVIKNNDSLIPVFLQKLAELGYNKKAMVIEFAVYNEALQVRECVEQWIQKYRGEYAQIDCQYHEVKDSSACALCDDANQNTIMKFGTIKNAFLRKTREKQCDFCLILESDIFLKPFALGLLVERDCPIISPLLRPVPNAGDLYRNFFVAATEAGYYKHSPDYFPIAERAKLGTFKVDCVSGAYLIKAEYAHVLNFIDENHDWTALAFSRHARRNGIDQYICNEREFGTFIHTDCKTLGDEKAFDTEIPRIGFSRDSLRELFKKYTDSDSSLHHYITQFPLDDYSAYPVENLGLFYVDEPYDWIKSSFIKKGCIWEEHVHKVLKDCTKPGSVALDLGGHIGTHTVSLSKFVGDAGTVHVFEPTVKLFSEMVINLFLNECNNVVCHRRAVGECEKVVKIFSPQAGNEGMSRIGVGGEKVQMEPIDRLNLNNISIMKIDIEGHEMEALLGAKETIARNKPVIVIEIFSGPARAEKIDQICQMGYTVSHLHGDDFLCLPIL